MRELFEDWCRRRSRTAVDGHRCNRRDREGRVRYYYTTLVAVIGRWQSGEGASGNDADEVAWLSRSEIIEENLPTAPALLPLIGLALRKADV